MTQFTDLAILEIISHPGAYDPGFGTGDPPRLKPWVAWLLLWHDRQRHVGLSDEIRQLLEADHVKDSDAK